MCQAPVKFFMVDFLQNELRKQRVEKSRKVKVNKSRKVKHKL